MGGHDQAPPLNREMAQLQTHSLFIPHGIPF
jgi:hypothetical protein